MIEELNPNDDVQKLERELGMPDGWLLSLLKEESDWSFVIRLHALFEAALVHVINAKLNKPELREFVERLNMRGPISKPALGKGLKVLDPKHARVIKMLSEIRSHCVNNVRNVAFGFDGYIDGLEPRKQQQLLRAFEDFVAAEVPVDDHGKKVPRDEFVRRGTRLAFWVAATLLLAEVYGQQELAETLARGFAQFTPGDRFGDGKGLRGKLPA